MNKPTVKEFPKSYRWLHRYLLFVVAGAMILLLGALFYILELI